MIEFKEQINLEEYDTFARNHELASINQSAKWAKIKNNWIPYHTGLYENNQLVAVALVLIRPLPLNLKFAYVPRGPLIDFDNAEHVSAMLEGLKQLAKKNKCLFVRMDPKVMIREFKLEDKDKAEPLSRGMNAIRNLTSANAKHLGFPLYMHDSFQPRFVATTYASENFENELPRRTKRFIKDANKHNVVINRKTTEDLDDFVRVLGETEDRKGIALRTKEYHKLIMDTYEDDALLLFAEVNLNQNYQEYVEDLEQVNNEIESVGDTAPKKLHHLKERQASLENLIAEVKPYLNNEQPMQVISGMLSVKYGHTTEHLYAGFDINFKKYMPQYKLYVEAMKYGFAQGDKYSSMGGVEGTLEDGLTYFKDHFNPTIQEYVGEFDIPTSMLYPLFMVAWNIRKKKNS